MRLVGESDDVINRVAAEAGVEASFARSVVADLRHVIDRFVADDVTVVLGPLLFRREEEPVFPAVTRRFTTADWQEPYGLKTLSSEGLAAELGLDPDVLEQYPIVFGTHVLATLFELRGLDWEDPRGDAVDAVFRAWRDTFKPQGGSLGRPYWSSHVGLEKDFEQWLKQNFQVLEEHGYPIQLVQEQRRFKSGGVADMVCRVTQDASPMRKGDWLLIENKATAVDMPALEQLSRYVAALELELDGEGAAVHGLLLADGITVTLEQALHEKGFGYASLSQLGYRDHLYRQHRLTTEADASVGSVPAVTATPAPTEAQDQSMARTPSAPGPWAIDGVQYVDRRAANRALARSLGNYSKDQWARAQRRVGLRKA